MSSQQRVPNSQPNSQPNTQPDTQPVTQNADTLTQSQDGPSQQTTLVVWGKLCPIRVLLRSLEMIKDCYTLGRAENCDICLTKNEIMHEKLLNTISKTHFRIYREHINNINETLIYLEDTSQNGTFVNKVRVGRGNRVILENNSEIAVSKDHLSLYMFVNTLMPEINDLPPELKMKYALGRKLGSGSCGEVRMVFTKDGSQRFAMKTIKKNIFDVNGHIFNQMKNEVEILRRLKHSCIIKMEDIHDTPTAMYIILELMEGGELFDRIRSRGKLTEPCAKLIFYQVVLAVYYLHKNGITHRDLKPENILLKSDLDKTLVKVSDFGLSKLVDARSMTMKTFCGTPMYVAPEILATLGRGSYTNQVDVWSLGVILYTCLSGMLPFSNQRKDISLEAQIRRGLYSLPSQYFGHLSQYAVDLIKRMMTVNPGKRITVPQILLHPWLRDQCMREEANKLMGKCTYNEQMINDENIPPSNNFENRRENLYPELKRTRLNA